MATGCHSKRRHIQFPPKFLWAMCILAKAGLLHLLFTSGPPTSNPAHLIPELWFPLSFPHVQAPLGPPTAWHIPTDVWTPVSGKKRGLPNYCHSLGQVVLTWFKIFSLNILTDIKEILNNRIWDKSGRNLISISTLDIDTYHVYVYIHTHTCCCSE